MTVMDMGHDGSMPMLTFRKHLLTCTPPPVQPLRGTVYYNPFR